MRLQEIIPYRRVTLEDLLRPATSFMGILTIILLLLFVWGGANYLINGHHTYGITREHPWGLLIAVYVFFVAATTGLCIVGSLGDVFGFEDYEVMSKRAIFGSIVTMISGFAVIAFDIGHPVTMVIYNVISPGLTSAIWWMGTLYGTYLVLIIIEFIFLLRNDMRRAKFFGLIGLLAGLAGHSNLGAVFGLLNARPVSNGLYYPVYFILLAFIMGIYLIFVMYGFEYRMKFPPRIKESMVYLARILALDIAVLLFVVTWKYITSAYGGMPERADIIWHVLGDPVFWIFEVFLSLLLPFIVILASGGKALKTLVWASLIGMVGIFVMRYNLVHASQLFPMQTLKIREYQLPPDLVVYTPTFTEIAISLGGLGFCLFLYYLGTRAFNLRYDATWREHE